MSVEVFVFVFAIDVFGERCEVLLFWAEAVVPPVCPRVALSPFSFRSAIVQKRDGQKESRKVARNGMIAPIGFLLVSWCLFKYFSSTCRREQSTR